MLEIEKQIRDEIRAAKKMKCPVLFPGITDFNKLFASAVVVRPGESIKSRDVHTWKVNELLPGGKVRKGTGRADLDSFCAVYCSTGDYAHLHVVPHPEIIQAIGTNMMLSDQYRINFQINVRDPSAGTALVTAHYNMICGSRWFAIIDASTIPR